MSTDKACKPRVSCTECRRRKQKCDRRWPCSHCRKRRIGEFCHFDSKLSKIDKRKGAERVSPLASVEQFTSSEKRASYESDQNEESVVHGLETWGYVHGLDHFNLSQSYEKIESAIPATVESTPEHVQVALQALPARSPRDRLVQHYLRNLNFTYYSIHPATFLTKYEEWCTARAQTAYEQPVDAAFLGLLLQMCANSSQCADASLRDAVQYELLEDARRTSQRLHDAAATLGQSFAPGYGGMSYVLRSLLAAAFLKGEGLIVDAWHALSAAIHEAQECGFSSSADGIPASLAESKIEAELRKRLWCYMILWDWQMAEWLDRPMLIDMRTAPLCVPIMALDGEGEEEPSPFEATFQQYRLIYAIAKNHGRLSTVKDSLEIERVQEWVSQWWNELPSYFIAGGADTRWDAKCSWLSLQRALLHCFAEMVMFTPLKKVLTASLASATDNAGQRLRETATETGLRCIATATRLHDVLAPIRLQFHFIAFAFFDTATVLCSRLLRDRNPNIPHRTEVLVCIRSALGQLENIATKSKLARTSANVLRYLISKLPSSDLLGDKAMQPKYPSPTSISADQNAMRNTVDIHQECMLDNAIVGLKDDPVLFTNTFDFDLSDLADLDFGGMRDIWTWDALNIGSWPQPYTA